MVNPLSRAGMKGILESHNPVISPRKSSSGNNVDLRTREENMIKDIIRGQAQVCQEGNNRAISLDEAAARIKNNY